MNAVRVSLLALVVLLTPFLAVAFAGTGKGRAPVKVRVKRPRKKLSPGETAMLKVKVKNRTKEDRSVRLELSFEESGEVFATEDLDLERKQRVRLLVPCVVPDGHYRRRLRVTARIGEVEDETEVRVSPDPAAELAGGRELYLENCAGCHGSDGADIRHEGLGDWLEAVREGEDDMPPIPGLTKTDIVAMRNYVLNPGAGRGPSEADQAWLRGREVFQTSCSGCHGDKGADIRHEDLDDWLEAVREGEDDMPAFPGLTEEDVRLARGYVLDPDRVVVDPEPKPDPAPGPDPAPSTPTYVGDVKAILDASCVSCHRSSGQPQGGVAMDTYASAFQNRVAIVDSVEKNRMPTFGSFPQASKDILRSWLDAGAPE